MKEKIKKIFIKILASLVMIFSIYNLYRDVNFFLFREKGVAQKLKISSNSHINKSTLVFAYYNNERRENMIDSVSLSDQNIKELRNKSSIEIYYTKYEVYISGYNSPRFPIIIFEIVTILLMIFLIYPITRGNE